MMVTSMCQYSFGLAARSPMVGFRGIEGLGEKVKAAPPAPRSQLS
jgi:hypothetical protein